MTEEDAKTKWCPFTRLIADNGGLTANRSDSLPDITRCMGSGCMAWRWDAEWDFNTAAPMGPDYERRAMALRSGYCGLAGKPS